MKGIDIRIGTLGGTLCSIWASFSIGDDVHTALMAVVRTVVSYATSRTYRENKEKVIEKEILYRVSFMTNGQKIMPENVNLLYKRIT